MSGRALAALALLLLTCRTRPGGPGGGVAADALAEARQFLDQGQADAALARLQGATDPEALLLQGRAWTKKAAAAPLPTAPPPASPLPRGATPPPAPEFKFEELQAIDCFERAASAQPGLAAAHLALADLLGPRALAREAQAAAAARVRTGRRGAVAHAVPAAVPGPDASPERVLREYRLAAQGDVASRSVVEAWIRFATSAGRFEDAEAAYQELLRRDKERAEPFVRYGDFLLASRKDPQGAIAQYSQALIWKADDEAVRAKVAEIYLGMASDHLAARQYASADARLKDARRYVSDRRSPLGVRLQELQQQLDEIRRQPGR